ncbi:hypothetical protein AB1E22_00325 [Buttiauxella gaviniae]|uniref:Glycoside hydrolase family 13 N-terminal domain-containing protein n=1 Tax=Buttiauxella gaviniae TaxID=82990 RepID=A0ABV3NNR7_9ENTR
MKLVKNFNILAGNGQLPGANFDGEGAIFASFSAHARRVELCLFDTDGQTELARFVLPEIYP